MEINTLRAQEAFILNLKAIMLDRSLSYKDLGDMIGVSKQQISNILNGPGSVSLKTVEKIADALNIYETDLFDPQFQDKYKKKVK